MKALLTSTALVAALGFSAAYAQSTDVQTDMQTDMQTDAQPGSMTMDTDMDTNIDMGTDPNLDTDQDATVGSEDRPMMDSETDMMGPEMDMSDDSNMGMSNEDMNMSNDSDMNVSGDAAPYDTMSGGMDSTMTDDADDYVEDDTTGNMTDMDEDMDAQSAVRNSTATLTTFDQPVDNGVVSASSITADENGWMVVHRTDDEMKPGPVVGYAPIRKGTTEDVAAILQEDVQPGEKLMLMVHSEAGGNETGVFEYTLGATEDGPVKKDGELVMQVITVE